jgi:chromosome segregation ATPase
MSRPSDFDRSRDNPSSRPSDRRPDKSSTPRDPNNRQGDRSNANMSQISEPSRPPTVSNPPSSSGRDDPPPKPPQERNNANRISQAQLAPPKPPAKEPAPPVAPPTNPPVDPRADKQTPVVPPYSKPMLAEPDTSDKLPSRATTLLDSDRGADKNLLEAKDTLKKIYQEDKVELENKLKDLTKKNTELKTSNGKLAMTLFLVQTELTRLDSHPSEKVSPLDLSAPETQKNMQWELDNLKAQNSTLQRLLDNANKDQEREKDLHYKQRDEEKQLAMQLRKEVAELRKELNDVRRDHEDCKRERDDYKDRVDAKRKEAAEAKEEARKNKDKLDEVSTDLDIAKKDLDDTKDAFKKAREDIAKLKRELEDSRDNANLRIEDPAKTTNETKKELETAKKQLADLKNQLYEVKNEIPEAKRELENLNKEIAQKKSSLDATKSELSDLKNKQSVLEAQKPQTSSIEQTPTQRDLDQISQRLAEAKAQLNHSEKELQENKNEISDAKKELANLKEDVHQHKKELADLIVKKTAMGPVHETQTPADYSAEIQEKKKELDSLKRELANKKVDLEEANKERERVKRKISESVAELDQINRDKAKEQAIITHPKEVTASKQPWDDRSELENLKRELTRANDALLSAKSDILDKNSQIANMQKQLEEVLKELEGARKDSSVAKIDLAEVRKELEDVRRDAAFKGTRRTSVDTKTLAPPSIADEAKELEEATKQIGDFQRELKEQKKLNSQLKNELSDVKNSYDEIRKRLPDLEDAKRRNEELRNVIEDLRREVTDRRKEADDLKKLLAQPKVNSNSQDDLSNILQGMQSDISSLRSQLLESRKEAIEAKRQAENKDRELEDIKLEKEDIKRDRDDLRTQSTETKKALIEAKREATEAIRANTDLRRELGEVKSNLESLQKLLDAVRDNEAKKSKEGQDEPQKSSSADNLRRAELENLKRELDFAKTEAEMAKRDSDTARKNAMDAMRDIDNIKLELDSKIRELNDKSKEVDSLKRQAMTPTDGKKMFIQESPSSSNDVDELKKELLDLRKENTNLRSQLLEREKESSTHRFAPAPSSGTSEEVQILKKENKVLKESIAELAQVRTELEALKRKAPEIGLSHNKDSSYITSNHGSPDKLREEYERLRIFVEKDRKATTVLEQEIKKLVSENRRLGEDVADKDKEIKYLRNKLATNTGAKQELNNVLKELHTYKDDIAAAQRNDELTRQNLFLKKELENLTDEVQVLKKLYADKGTKPGSKPNSRGNSANRTGNNTERDTAHPQNTAKASMAAMVEKFLLGLEIQRLNFSNLNCRCKSGNTLSGSRVSSPENTSAFLKKAQNDPLLGNGMSFSRNASPGQNAGPRRADMAELTALIKERDSLKQLLSDYQKRMLDSKRLWEQENDRSRYGAIPMGEQSAPTFRGDDTTRELELKVKVLQAENKRLGKVLDQFAHPDKASVKKPPGGLSYSKYTN